MIRRRVDLSPELFNRRSLLDSTFSEFVWHKLVLVVVDYKVERIGKISGNILSFPDTIIISSMLCSVKCDNPRGTRKYRKLESLIITASFPSSKNFIIKMSSINAEKIFVIDQLVYLVFSVNVCRRVKSINIILLTEAEWEVDSD